MGMEDTTVQASEDLRFGGVVFGASTQIGSRRPKERSLAIDI